MPVRRRCQPVISACTPVGWSVSRFDGLAGTVRHRSDYQTRKPRTDPNASGGGPRGRFWLDSVTQSQVVSVAAIGSGQTRFPSSPAWLCK